MLVRNLACKKSINSQNDQMTVNLLFFLNGSFLQLHDFEQAGEASVECRQQEITKRAIISTQFWYM